MSLQCAKQCSCKASEETSCLGLKTSLQTYTMQDKYVVLRLMAQGSFGKVFLSRHCGTGIQVALKELKRAGVGESFIKIEVGILKDLQHPNITQLLEVIEDQHKVHLVLEYVMGVNLRQEIRRSHKNRLHTGPTLLLPATLGAPPTLGGPKYRAMSNSVDMDVLLMADQPHRRKTHPPKSNLLAAVDYCHDRGIVHGDLKPANVLIDTQGWAKVCDFGLGIQFHPGQKVTAVGGTLAYSSPEKFSRKRYEGPPLDIWALGVTLCEMLTGDYLFAECKSQIIENIMHGTVSYPKFISNNAKRLIGKILTWDPTKRPTIQKILKHRWIRGVRPPSPPEPLPVNIKRAILSRMAGMGFDPLIVMDNLRRKNYAHEMATYLLLQTQALQGPVHEAVQETSCCLTGPAPSDHVPWRRLGEPVPCTGCLFPRVKARGEQEKLKTCNIEFYDIGT
ncbi:sperm motility kinase 2B-like [Fukomys damarensis]|uniref:sperm motility kinase 2B-like n=1 Tax=Fukomys damarensis TaxID=885580 RepID=UPI0014558158|nr:sperm motility kinase 2B-like [Fukomys damarensis]